jgi:hypothetical protein
MAEAGPLVIRPAGTTPSGPDERLRRRALPGEAVHPLCRQVTNDGRESLRWSIGAVAAAVM